jgi:hypothetical protein
MSESLRKGADGPTRVTPSAGARARDVSRDVDAEKAGIRAWLEARDAEAGVADHDGPSPRPVAERQPRPGRPESS